ncbi:lymphatic vessel endothelial hyaluronic acid receptor 1a [Cololabis saira]|uniref:lymphatic vessel endothelial hyaluronic acid receptor 1a n=1 Tax=Cololabis saira TaxID=129043 RepID=UPI002AD27FA4|nr:lymphatic vessel endothelial hyaluronic acid receptor 1a [Cololabis saira]
MNIVWLCITSVLSATSAFSHQNISNFRVFPALNQSIAGVTQVSYLNDQNQPQYAFNASEARRLCQSLGLNIASRAEVEDALRRGLETCRFGWIDEHFAVIPRIHALANCGQKQIGLVPWRAPVSQQFDVFCFNESDAEAQLKNGNYPWEYDQSPSKTTDFTLTTLPTSSSSSPLFSSTSADEIMNNEVEQARLVSSANGSAGVKVVLIACTCGLLLISMIIIAYLKLRGHCPQNSDVKQQQEYIQTEECERVKNITETTSEDQEDQRIQVEDDTP